MGVRIGGGLARVLRERLNVILARWMPRVRAADERAAKLSELDLRDEMPHLMAEIADTLSDPARIGRNLIGKTPEKHALHRLDRGYELGTLLREYQLLRDTIYEELEEQEIESS